MSFNPTQGNAGNDAYTLTVGGGANMSIGLKYEWSGNPGNVVTVDQWEHTLDSSGQAKNIKVNHNDAPGTYWYHAIKNSSTTDWVNFSPPYPTFTLLPPKPFPNSLSITPSSIKPPATYTMTAGNTGGANVDARYTLNSSGSPYITTLPTFGSVPNHPPGEVAQAPVSAATCTTTGDYLFTGLRNTLLPNSDWSDQTQNNNPRIFVSCPDPPAIVPNTVGPVIGGTTATLSIAGNSLCGPMTIWSDDAGITFPAYAPEPHYEGQPVTATVTVAGSVTGGLHPFHIGTPCGSAPGWLNVLTNASVFVSRNVTDNMVPGGVYPATLTFQNSGSSTWTSAGGYQLGSQNPANNNTWGMTRVSLAPGESIAPGASKTFSFNVPAPSTPGVYNFQWQMVQNGVWFGDVSLNKVIGVAFPPVVASITPSSGKQGQHGFQITITGSNLTGATLSAPASSKIAFANPNPTDSLITAYVAVANDAPTQTVPITVTTWGGSQTINFSVTPANPQGTPVVNSISPTMMLTATTQTFTLLGSNLTNATVTADDALSITNTSNVNDTELHVTIAANGAPAGTYPLTVTVPQYGLTTTRLRVLDSVSKPSIESVTPPNPNAGGIYYFHLTGNNLAGAIISCDIPGVHINTTPGMVSIEPGTVPADYDVVVGLLSVDPNVVVGNTPVPATITVTNASGSDSVQITISAGSASQGIQAQKPKLVKPRNSFDKQVQNQIIRPLLGFGDCSAGCNLFPEIDLVSFRVGIPFIECGDNLFDASCLDNIKIGNPINLRVGFLGFNFRIFSQIGFQQYCPAFEPCICTPEPCSLSVDIDIEPILPLSQSLSFTAPLADFLLSTPADCSQPGVCTDTINVVSLPQDARICAGLVNMTFLGAFRFAPSATCVDVTPGLNATLTATPPTIKQGSVTVLSWAVSTSQGNPIRVHHVHIFNNVNDPPYDCGDELFDITPCDPSQSVPLRPSGNTTYSADFRGSAGILPDSFPSPDSPGQVAAAQARVTVIPVSRSQTTFISPSIVSLKSRGTRQLIPTDAQGNSLGQFPQGTTFSTVTFDVTAQNGRDTASIDQTGLVTGNSTPGVVWASAYLPDQTFLTNSKTLNRPFVQVGPMRLYLRFLPDAISFMKGSFPSSGLDLSDSEVTSIESAVVGRVQSLFSTANVVVMLSQPAGWGRPDAGSDAVVTMDISAQRDSNGNFSPPRRYSDTGTVRAGEAPVNGLDFLNAFFGADALEPDNNGVFINQLPLINLSSLRVSNDLIANGIANLAAHEFGHTLGLVPNSDSQSQATQIGDNRFAGVTFDGDAKHHFVADLRGIMQEVFSGVAADGTTPIVLSTELSFRNNENAYLAAILPR